MDFDELHVRTCFVLWDDCRALVSALKSQRWEVAKWAVTVNLGLGAATVSITQDKYLFVLFAVGVFLLGCFLIYHYNERVTNVRSRLTKVTGYIRSTFFDFNSVLDLDVGREKGPDHDRQELFGFYAALTLSIFPSFAAAIIG